MWCGACGQDVPALAGLEAGRLQCARCGHVLRKRPEPTPGLAADRGRDSSLDSAAEAAARPPVKPFPEPLPLTLSDWELAAQVSRVRRWLATDDPPADSGPTVRVDDPHGGQAPWWANRRRRPAPVDGRSASTLGTIIAGAAAWLGLAATICGLALAGQALVLERENLWPISLLLVLAGLAGMAPGLAIMLASWHRCRTMNTPRPPLHRGLLVGHRPGPS